jgi:hypothetical protein
VLKGEQLALKCLLFPYTRIPAIADTTRTYALRYPAGMFPVAARVLASTNKWILMDMVEGSNLREFLQQRRVAEGNSSPLLRTDLLASIGKPLLKSLHELSCAGLQHEDLTPSNIMIRAKEDGSVDRVMLIDLGRNYLYSRHVGLEASREALFVAPEIKAGQSVEETSDLYSFGMVLIELADPFGVQRGMIPESLYEYAPHLARFIEDLIDRRSEYRRLIFPKKEKQSSYADLCLLFENLLTVLPSEREVKPGKFFWFQQFQALFYPSNQLKHAWGLWRRTRSSSMQPDIARHTGRLFGWLVVSMVSSWLIFTVTFLWGARDFGLGFFPNPIALLQALLPHCGGTCVPILDGLQASDYVFGLGNMPARLVGFTTGLVQSVYYANILAGLTARPIRGKLAYGTEIFLRLQAIAALPLVLIGNLYEPRWWLALLVLGYPIPALTNMLCYRLSMQTLRQARRIFSTVPLLDDSSLKNFGQWGTTFICYIFVLFLVWLGLHLDILHDRWAYAISIVVINVFVHCLSKCIILAPGVRGSLNRAFTVGERLTILTERSKRKKNELDPFQESREM